MSIPGIIIVTAVVVAAVAGLTYLALGDAEDRDDLRADDRAARARAAAREARRRGGTR